MNVENTGTYTKAVSTINIPLWARQMTLDPCNKADVQATTYPPHSIMKLHYAWDLGLHDHIIPEIALCSRNASLHVPDNACARRNSSLHCAWRNASLDVPEDMYHCMFPIMHAPEEMHHCIAPKEIHYYIARYCMCPKKCIIACARRNASLDVLDIACAQRNASSHCARDCIVPEICISSRLHRARSFHVPELNQVISINRCQKQILSLYSLLISQRRHPPKASSFMACGLHVMAWGLILCLPCP